VITELDDVSTINFRKHTNIVFYKTSILGEYDLEIPEKILKENTSCNLLINSIFLSPKFADILLNGKHNIKTKVMMSSVYFSDFFIKYESFIKNPDGLFKSERLVDYYQKIWKHYFP